MPRLNGFQIRLSLVAYGEIPLHTYPASRSKPAALGQVNQIRDRPLDDFQALFGLAKDRDGLNKPQRVRMKRLLEEPCHRGLLDYLARIHDGDPISGLCDHTQVMGDQDHGRIHLAAQVPDQIQNLRLNGHIQSRGWLIGDQQSASAMAIMTRWACPPDISWG